MGYQVTKTSLLQFALAIVCYWCVSQLINDLRNPIKLYYRISFLLTASAGVLGGLRYGGVRRISTPIDLNLEEAHDLFGFAAKTLGITGLGLGAVSIVHDTIQLDSPIVIAASLIALSVFLYTHSKRNLELMTALQGLVILAIVVFSLQKFEAKSSKYNLLGVGIAVAGLSVQKKNFGDWSGRDVFLVFYAASNTAFAYAAKYSHK